MASGGKREGSGRPSVKDARQSLTIRVAPETREKLRELKACGYNLSRAVDALVADAYADMRDESK